MQKFSDLFKFMFSSESSPRCIQTSCSAFSYWWCSCNMCKYHSLSQSGNSISFEAAYCGDNGYYFYTFIFFFLALFNQSLYAIYLDDFYSLPLVRLASTILQISQKIGPCPPKIANSLTIFTFCVI